MSRSSVTTWFEVVGLLLIAGAAGVGLYPFGLVWALAIAGWLLILFSMLLQVLAPQPRRDTVEAE